MANRHYNITTRTALCNISFISVVGLSSIMAKQVSVSQNFKQFLGREHNKIEAAKQAEARLSNVPVPLGAKGKCLVTGFVFTTTPDKTENNTFVPGKPLAEIQLTIVNHETHQGKVLKKQWWFTSSAKMDAAGRFEMFLNDLMKLGLPEEIRKNHENPEELAAFFLDNDTVLHFEIVEDSYQRMDDGKGIRLSTVEGHIPKDDSIIPGIVEQNPNNSTSTSPTIPSPKSKEPVLSPGDITKYLGTEWTVTENFGTKVQLKNNDDPKIQKIVSIADLDK